MLLAVDPAVVDAFLGSLGAGAVGEDTTTRLVLADYLEEQGDDAGAACQRWLAARGAAAWRWKTRMELGYGWTKMDNWFVRQEKHPDYCRYALPNEVYIQIAHPPQEDGDWVCGYGTRLAAEQAALQAWRKAWAAGWRPEEGK